LTGGGEPVASRLTCSGCGALVPAASARPWRCPAETAGDDVDHLVQRTLDLASLRFPAAGSDNPFVRYRELLHAYQAGRAAGLGDGALVDRIESLDRAVAAVDGRGFRATPFAPAPELARRLGFAGPGEVWIKDETGNVSGSHKARHLAGIALWLAVADALADARGERVAPVPLAIASCGNAALAAAVIARAARRPLEVFIPPDAEPAVVERLAALGAGIAVCARERNERGDPCLRRFRAAVAGGAVPFTCQGSENGLTIEGGHTLGYEMAATLAQAGRRLDRVLIQVGGGALASAVIQALREAVALGAMQRLPRIDVVETQAVHPLARAWERLGRWITDHPGPQAGPAALRHAARHRSQFMWPWESAPMSVARGILDDETYDWRAVAAGMLETGGAPVLVSEAVLEEALALAREATAIPVSATGSAGLAGLLELRRAGLVASHERVALLFTGIER
jgi:threonine synthase